MFDIILILQNIKNYSKKQEQRDRRRQDFFSVARMHCKKRAASMQPVMLLTLGNAVNCAQFLYIKKHFSQPTLTGHLVHQ